MKTHVEEVLHTPGTSESPQYAKVPEVVVTAQRKFKVSTSYVKYRTQSGIHRPTLTMSRPIEI